MEWDVKVVILLKKGQHCNFPNTIDRIPTKTEPCLTPTLMDEGQARNPNKPTMGIKWISGSLP